MLSAGLISLFLSGLLTPTIYATADSTPSSASGQASLPQADGQFPVFPTVIEGESASTTDATTTSETIISPALPPATKKEIQKGTTVVQRNAEIQNRGVKNKYVTNELGVFSPWGTIKRAISGRAMAGGEGVMLVIEAVRAKPTTRGDLRYEIFYANNADETLRNVSIQIALPKDFQYLDSDVRPDSKGNGLVTYDLGKVASGETGLIQLEVRAKKSKVKDAFVSATMSYEDIDGNAQLVNATASNVFNGKNGGGFSASILDGVGGFMLWLFVIILLIAIAFAAYQLVVLKSSVQPRT